MSFYSKKNKSGQTMILVSLALGGTILGVTAIAGLVMLFSLRQTTDIASGVRALYAADTGIELGNYLFYRSSTSSNAYLSTSTQASGDPQGLLFPSSGPGINEYTMDNGASFKYGCKDYDASTQTATDVDCRNTTANLLISIGTAENSSRALRGFLSISP